MQGYGFMPSYTRKLVVDIDKAFVKKCYFVCLSRSDRIDLIIISFFDVEVITHQLM